MAAVPSARTVTVVVCRRDGSILGSLPEFEVDMPWWQEVGSIVQAVRIHFGLEVTVLRLLDGAGAGPPGGRVTYLASVVRDPALALSAWTGPPVVDEPLRLGYAKPGGPELDLAWADAALSAVGTPRTGPAEQVRTWNLSSLWRLPRAPGAAWLKVVPPFLAHEGAIIALLDRSVVPPLIATDGPRTLIEEVPGEDLYGAGGEVLERMVRVLVELQLAWTARTGELEALGLPDWRAEAFIALAHDVAERTAGELDQATNHSLAALLERLPERYEALERCGIPDSLVHGDFFPGNFRGAGERMTLLDWGDCGIGHPLFDQTAFLDRIAPDARSAVWAEWCRQWRAAVPGCRPKDAGLLIAPIAAIRQAIVYRGFLDRIEPSERIYHASDPRHWLRRATGLGSNFG
jgi:hypothetical protein